MSWIVTAGSSTWVDAYSPYRPECHCQPGVLSRYGPRSRSPHYSVPDHGLFRGAGLQGAAVGNERAGLWALRAEMRTPSATSGTDEVVHIASDTGRWAVVAHLRMRLPLKAGGLHVDQGAVLNGSVYFVLPSTRLRAPPAPPRLVRVTLSTVP